MSVKYIDIDTGLERKETFFDRHPTINVLLFRWGLSGSLVDDGIVLLKYAVLFALLIAAISLAPCVFDTSNAGPYFNGCYERALRGW